jgi:hypothetical protein
MTVFLAIVSQSPQTMKVPGTTNAKHAISDPIIPVSHNESYADISITGLPLTIDMRVRI